MQFTLLSWMATFILPFQYCKQYGDASARVVYIRKTRNTPKKGGENSIQHDRFYTKLRLLKTCKREKETHINTRVRTPFVSLINETSSSS